VSSEIVRARVLDHLGRLRLGRIAEQLDALLSAAARGEPTYLDFLDAILREEVGAKQRKRVAMGIQIAHFPTVKTLDDFDFKFQPSVDQLLAIIAKRGNLNLPVTAASCGAASRCPPWRGRPRAFDSSRPRC
jgi:DNA replication protein DnaC